MNQEIKCKKYRDHEWIPEGNVVVKEKFSRNFKKAFPTKPHIQILSMRKCRHCKSFEVEIELSDHSWNHAGKGSEGRAMRCLERVFGKNLARLLFVGYCPHCKTWRMINLIAPSQEIIRAIDRSKGDYFKGSKRPHP